MELKELQQRQAEYDKEGWQHEGDLLTHVRHITLHLGKMLGELSAYCEAGEHDREYPLDKIKDGVIPDLLMHAFRLANHLDIDIEQAFLAREKRNTEKYLSKD